MRKLCKKCLKYPEIFLFSRFAGNLFSQDRVFLPHGWQRILVSFHPIDLLFFCFNGKRILFWMTKKISILTKTTFFFQIWKFIHFFSQNFYGKKKPTSFLFRHSKEEYLISETKQKVSESDKNWQKILAIRNVTIFRYRISCTLNKYKKTPL